MNTETKPLTPLLQAASRADWMQVILNGGPPCFHLDGTFCFRAERWEGHGVKDFHEYVSLLDFMKAREAAHAATQERLGQAQRDTKRLTGELERDEGVLKTLYEELGRLTNIAQEPLSTVGRMLRIPTLRSKPDQALRPAESGDAGVAGFEGRKAVIERELDALIAEKVMGWHNIAESDWHYHRSYPLDFGGIPPGEKFVHSIPLFSTDRNAAAKVLERIEELGLQTDWGSALLSEASDASGLSMFEVATATPRQICEAALKCVSPENAEVSHAPTLAGRCEKAGEGTTKEKA